MRILIDIEFEFSKNTHNNESILIKYRKQDLSMLIKLIKVLLAIRKEKNKSLKELKSLKSSFSVSKILYEHSFTLIDNFQFIIANIC